MGGTLWTLVKKRMKRFTMLLRTGVSLEDPQDVKSAEEHQGPSLEEEHAQQALLGASRDDGRWSLGFKLPNLNPKP